MAAVLEPFEHTATGVLGDKRETMLKNQLLLRNELAQPMRRGYTNYPGEVYTYGRPNAAREGGANEALSGWPNSGGLYFHRKESSSLDSQPDRDFMALNRAAVQAGLTSAPQHYNFRATHDIRCKIQTEEGKKTKTRRLPPTQVYGIATRPSTPIHDLLEHKYQDNWLQDRRSADMAAQSKKDTQQRLAPPGKVYETRATQLRVHQVPVSPAPLWQLPRFVNKARPHLDTFGSTKAKNAAFKAHKSDGISRQGVFGQGIYEPAKN